MIRGLFLIAVFALTVYLFIDMARKSQVAWKGLHQHICSLTPECQIKGKNN